MPARPEYREGQYKFVCDICGLTRYSNEMIIGEVSGLVRCGDHYERENYDIHRFTPPAPSHPPHASGKVEDVFNDSDISAND